MSESQHIHNSLVEYYTKAKILKSKRKIQKESIISNAYQKKVIEVDTPSPFQDFLRNQQHIVTESQSLGFRQLPRKLKVYFHGPPNPPPPLEEIPYTYEIVPKVTYKMPKQKPGYVGNWVLQESRFVDRKSKSLIQRYEKQKFQRKDRRQLHQKFRSSIKNVIVEMRSKSLSLGEVIKNKGFIKKPHTYYNSIDFFQAIKENDHAVEKMIQINPHLAYDVDSQKMTALHWAAREGHVYIAKILLERFRANPEARDMYGRTAMHLAVTKRNPECIIRIFIEGGRLNSMDHLKKTVKMVATDSYTKYLLEKLQEAKFLAKAKTTSFQQYKIELEKTIRQSLDQTSLYF